jgi:hypothetical protein
MHTVAIISKQGDGAEARVLRTTPLRELFRNKTPKCAVCLAETTLACGGCKTLYYCSRECQLKNWPEHKATCARFVNRNSRERISNAVQSLKQLVSSDAMKLYFVTPSSELLPIAVDAEASNATTPGFRGALSPSAIEIHGIPAAADNILDFGNISAERIARWDDAKCIEERVPCRFVSLAELWESEPEGHKDKKGCLSECVEHFRASGKTSNNLIFVVTIVVDTLRYRLASSF